MNRTLRLLSMVAVLGLMTCVSVHGTEVPITQVPDGGSTLALLGAALAGLGLLRRRLAA